MILCPAGLQTVLYRFMRIFHTFLLSRPFRIVGGIILLTIPRVIWNYNVPLFHMYCTLSQKSGRFLWIKGGSPL
jgi:hypothetical protein